MGQRFKVLSRTRPSVTCTQRLKMERTSPSTAAKKEPRATSSRSTRIATDNAFSGSTATATLRNPPVSQQLPYTAAPPRRAVPESGSSVQRRGFGHTVRIRPAVMERRVRSPRRRSGTATPEVSISSVSFSETGIYCLIPLSYNSFCMAIVGLSVPSLSVPTVCRQKT